MPVGMERLDDGQRTQKQEDTHAKIHIYTAKHNRDECKVYWSKSQIAL